MKAVTISRFGGPEVLDVTDVPRPEPGHGEVLVRARAFGVGRPDSLMRQGLYKWSPPLPFNPGNQLAGDIEQLGGGVEGLSVAQPVLVSARDLPQRGGLYSECVVVPADCLYAMPIGVRYEDAVCLANYEVAWALLHDMIGPRMAKTALVVGAAGGVGSALLQLGRRAGLELFAMVGSEAKAAFARTMGAQHVIARGAADLSRTVMEATGGAGVDLVFDHVGGPGFASYFDLLSTWGTVVSYGALQGDPGGDIVGALRRNVGKSPGMRCFSIHSYDGDPEGRRQTVRNLVDLLFKGEIRPAIAATFDLEEVREAHRLLDDGSVCGRIVMLPPEAR